MRRFVFCVLTGVLLALVTARALLPESAQAASDAQLYGYNIQSIRLPLTEETAGSALIAEMDRYWLYRTPTAKSEWTGACAGRDLVVICAEDWTPPAEPARYREPGLWRLARESAALPAVYRPDWFQGAEGRAFALLTGIVPTTVGETSALAYTGTQEIDFPFALARMLSREGYDCRAYVPRAPEGAYEALGFGTVTETDAAGGAAAIASLADADRFFAFLLWSEEDGEAALETLVDGLRAARRLDSAVICLYAGGDDPLRARLYLSGPGLQRAASGKPCSDLDLTPTLLNLFGADYDSRFLSGRDIFARNDEPGVVRSVTPTVSLYGSAGSDWVTDAGQYTAAGRIFRQTADCFSSSEEVSAYVRAVTLLVCERYTYARRVMENNYFRILLDTEPPPEKTVDNPPV